MLHALLPLYLDNVLGARMAAIGLIEGVAETTSSLLKIVSGWLSDHLGKRKLLAVAGYAISTTTKPLLLFANTWGVMLAVRFAERFGKGVRVAPRDALVADSTDPSQRGLAFGIHRAGDTAGAVVGLSVALAVVWTSQRSAVVLERAVFQTLVLLCLAPAALGVAALAVGAKDAPHSSTRSTRPRLGLTPYDRRFKRFLIVMVVFTLGNSSDAFLVLRAQRAGLSVAGVIGMMISFNLVYTLASGPAGALSDRIGRRRIMIAGWLVYALIYLGFARAETGAEAWVLMTVYSVYYASTEGVAKAYVADLVPADFRGTAYGVFNAAVGIAALPSSIFAGVLWQGIGSWPGFGPAAPFYFGSAIALIAACMLAWFVPPRTEHPSQTRTVGQTNLERDHTENPRQPVDELREGSIR
jgi:MFS family permease